MNEPRISIVTPSYDQGQFLEETILSVLNQDYPNLEYIVMDGGSTDNSVEIIKKYQDHLAHWVSEPDEGQSDAINKGFRIASGEIMTWLNSDDYYLPGTLHTIAEFFTKHQDIECVYGDLQIVDADSDLIYTSKALPYDYKIMLYGGARVPQPASFFLRNVIDQVGYLNTGLHYTMDIEYFIRFGKQGIHFAHIPQPLSCFRVHMISKTQDRKKLGSEFRQVTTMYTGQFFDDERLHNAVLSILQWFYRVVAFTKRAITRGDLVPFRTRWTRWKTSRM